MLNRNFHLLIGKTFLTFAPSKVKSNKIHTAMKKIFTLITMAVLALTFAACDNRYYDDYYRGSDYYDSDDAFVLEGTWTGFIETYMYDRFGKTGNDYRTTMYFERENAYGGWGYEVDYSLRSRYQDYYYCEFRWEVVGGDICVRYADSWNDVWIYPSRLTATRFSGTMFDGTSRDIYFDMVYDGNFDWAPYRYYAPTRGAGETPRYHASGEFAKKTDEGTSK